MMISVKKCDNKHNNLLSTDPFKVKSTTLKTRKCQENMFCLKTLLSNNIIAVILEICQNLNDKSDTECQT